MTFQPESNYHPFNFEHGPRTCRLCGNKHFDMENYCSTCRDRLTKKYGPGFERIFLDQETEHQRDVERRRSLMKHAAKEATKQTKGDDSDKTKYLDKFETEDGNDFKETRSILSISSDLVNLGSAEVINRRSQRILVWKALKLILGVCSIALALGWAKYVGVGYVYLPSYPDYLDVCLGAGIGLFLLADYFKDMISIRRK